jgi:HD-GYP domain-containing protein (c-di-GMP phosphodiesterase class II)
MSTKRVPVYELQIGMYVARLDLSWFRSPFLRHSFLIEDIAQISRLIRAGVKTVEIDLERGVDVPDARYLKQSLQKTTQTSSTATPLALQAQKSLARLNEEYTQAKLAKEQLDRAVQSIFAIFSQHGTIEARLAAEAVQEITIAARTISKAALFMALSQNRAGDSTLSRHALATCTLSLVLGQTFQFNPLELQQLGTAALLHDLGLLQVPSAVVRRSRTTSAPLSSLEQRQFQAHPRLSILALERQGGFDASILHFIAEHHALLDGSGYPSETRGEFTSDRTRILIIADRYDEFVTGFGGASPLGPHQALQRLYQEAREGKLDHDILTRLIKLVGIYPVHSYVQLNTKEIGVVASLNPATLHQPVVAITHDPQGTGYPTPLVVDLAHQEGRQPERAIESVLDRVPTTITSDTSQAA